MNKAALNQIHDEIPERLREKGFEEKVEAAKTEANQKISMIQEEVTKFEYDMSQNQERLIMDTQDLNGFGCHKERPRGPLKTIL